MKTMTILMTMMMSITLGAFESGGVPFVFKPSKFQCWPKSPTTKKYLSRDEGWFSTTIVLTCDYLCLHPNGGVDEITGTRIVKFFGKEKGNESVCKGYEKDMEYVQTPTSTSSWGFYRVGKVRPFNPLRSDVKELKEWALNFDKGVPNFLRKMHRY